MKILSIIKKNIPLLIVFVVASIVYLYNLDSQGFSLDESHTVSVARTILSFGYPSTWDGQTLLTMANGNDFTFINGKYFWTWHPWLQFYLIAPFYFLFENSVTMLRFPFALLGIISIVVFYFLTQELFKNKWLSVILSLHLIFLLPYFLYIRQVRYYSPSALFSIILFWLLIKLVKNKFNKKLFIIFSLTSMLLLATNYLIWASCIALFIPFAMWKRNKSIILMIVAEVLLALLWFLYFTPFGGSPQSAYSPEGEMISILSIVKYFSYLNNFIFPLILIPISIFSAWKLHLLRYVWIIIFWISGKILLYSLVLDVQGRYLTDIAPITLLLLGFIYLKLWKLKYFAMIVFLVVVLMLTNTISIIPSYIFAYPRQQFRFIPQQFASEFLGKYPHASDQIGRYLSHKASQGDLFWSNNYKWDIYLSSGVPPLATICNFKTGRFEGPQTITHPRKVKWFIFYQYDSRLNQDLSTIPCMGETWQTYMTEQYTKKVFPLDKDTYHVGDPDIVNREFPPTRIKQDSIIIYEKRYY